MGQALTLNQEEMNQVLYLHKRFLRGKEDGVKAKLSGHNLRHVDLRAANLSGAELYIVDLYQANLYGSDFSKCDLEGANFCLSNLRESSLKGARLYQADMSNADLRDALLTESNMEEADCQEANLEGTQLENACLCKTKFIGANLRAAKLMNADLSGADLWKANLSEADLTNANLTDADLSFAIGNGREIVTVQADGRHVNITDDQIWINDYHYTWHQWMCLQDSQIETMDLGRDKLNWWQQWKPMLNQIINLRSNQNEFMRLPENELAEILRQHEYWTLKQPNGERADLSKTDMRDSDFSGVNLEDAILRGGDFRRVNLTKTNLKQTDLSHTNLSNATMVQADLGFANLYRTDFTESDLSGANLAGARLHQTIGNGREILTVHAGSCHVNITNDQIWIDDHHHTWDEWLSLDDKKIEAMNLNGEKTLEFWRQWKPELTRIIEMRKQIMAENAMEKYLGYPSQIY